MDWLSFFVGVLVGWVVELIIDYLFWQKRCARLDAENEELRSELQRMEAIEAKNLELRKELARLQALEEEHAALKAELDACRQQLAAPEDTASTRAEPAASIAPEDLKVVEGIGPKIEQILHAAGILTLAMLAETEIDVLRQILAEAGPRFRLADPSTWPQQARLAAVGDWDALQALQDTLSGGRR